MMITIAKQRAHDADAIEQLLDVTFGADRQKKAAYRLRDHVSPVEALSFVVLRDDELVGTLRFWPVIIKDEAQEASLEALLLGPIAITPSLQGLGHGLALMAHGLDQARALGHKIVLLVGDEPYYRKVGFSRALAENLVLPDVEDESRFLAQELVPAALGGVTGIVQAANR